MSDFKVTGAEDFYKLSKSLKAAGRTELRKELTKGMRKATKPLIAKTKSAAGSTLPRRGGLAALVAREPQRVQVRTGAQTFGVRIVVGRTKGGARGADAGTVRHPVFGHRDRFVAQPVTPGWFTASLEAAAPLVQPEIEAAMEAVAQKIVQGAK